MAAQGVPNIPVVAPAAPAIQAAQAAPVPFALGPSQALNGGVIDFTTREGHSLFKNNTRCLYSDKTNLFAADAEGLDGFLINLAERAEEADWTIFLDVPVDLAQPAINAIPLLQNYGRFDLPHLMAHSATFVGDQSRAAQDNHQVAIAIMASLSDVGKAKIVPWQADYKINGTTAALALIKVIIRESHIDSNATTRRIRDNLSSLDEHLKHQGYDVSKLNTFVQGQLASLRARGETTMDLLPNLFKGYRAATDKAFKKYIDEKESRYDEGEDITPEMLMTLASNKYKVLVDSGLWNTPNRDQAKILALEGQIKKLQEKKSGKPNKNGKERPERLGKYVRPAWMDLKPSEEDLASDKIKTVEGKKYWWCQKHGYYCQHSTAECRGPSQKKTEEQMPKIEPKDNKKLQLAKALQAAIDANESDSDSSSE